MYNVDEELKLLNQKFNYEFSVSVLDMPIDTRTFNIHSKSGFLLARVYSKDIETHGLFKILNIYADIRLSLVKEYDRLAELCTINPSLQSNRIELTSEGLSCSESIAVISKTEINDLIKLAEIIKELPSLPKNPVSFTLFEAKNLIKYNDTAYIARINGSYINLKTGTLATQEEYDNIKAKADLMSL